MTGRIRFSVVIPTYNRADRLSACLEALCHSTHPAFEVIVVDDGSARPMAPIADSFADRLRITALRQDNAGPASARNRGAAIAKGQWIAFTDDDCRPRPDWLIRLEAGLEKNPKALVGGHTVNALTDNIYAQVSQDLVTFLYGYRPRRHTGLSFFTSNNMACSAERFCELGGFDDGFPLAAAEDRDFGMRWLDAGWPLVHAPGAEVLHAHPLTLRRYWAQHSNYGRGARHLRRRLKARASRPLEFEGFRFYAALAGVAFQDRKWSRAPARLALLMLSQVATVSGFLTETLRTPVAHSRR